MYKTKVGLKINTIVIIQLNKFEKTKQIRTEVNKKRNF